MIFLAVRWTFKASSGIRGCKIVEEVSGGRNVLAPAFRLNLVLDSGISQFYNANCIATLPRCFDKASRKYVVRFTVVHVLNATGTVFLNS